MNQTVRERLQSMADPDYAVFAAHLIPDSKPLLGIRLPLLRNIAKELSKGDSQAILADKTKDIWFEEIMLRGMLMGYGSSRGKDINEALSYLDAFIPMVDNWSICDSCCVSFTIFQMNREMVWTHIQPYLYSKKEFDVRVGLILLLNHFLKFDAQGNKIARKRTITLQDTENEMEAIGEYTERILHCCNRFFNQGYYAQMAAAWLIAEAFVTFPYHVLKFLHNNQLDEFTYRKALQKICESKIPDVEVKAMIKGLK